MIAVALQALVLCLVLAGTDAHPPGAPDRRLWGALEPGPHAVGFVRSWQLDHARQYAPAVPVKGALSGPLPAYPRPILVNLWYPARECAAAPMRYREYFEMGSDNPSIAPFAKRLEAFTRATMAEEVLEELPQRLMRPRPRESSNGSMRARWPSKTLRLLPGSSR